MRRRGALRGRCARRLAGQIALEGGLELETRDPDGESRDEDQACHDDETAASQHAGRPALESRFDAIAQAHGGPPDAVSGVRPRRGSA